MRFRRDPRRRLAAIREERERLRARVEVLDEQLAFQEGVADQTAADATVGSPLDAREHRAAVDDARRTRRERDEVVQRLRRLDAEQDALLDDLAERADHGAGS